MRALNVLVVEDSEDDALLLLRQLGKSDFQVRARRVQTAAELAAALEEEPWDVVISDYVLPRFDALEALRLLQAHDLDIPFIIVSGAIGEEIAAAAMRAGAHDFLMKGHLTRLVPIVERELMEVENRRSRRRAQDELRISEERYRSLVLATSHLIWIVDAQGRPIDGSAAWERLTGQSLASTIEHGWIQAIHPDDRPTALEHWSSFITSRSPVAFDCRIRVVGGEYRYFAVRAVPVFAETGEVREWIGTAEDVTDRRMAEVRLREANEAKDRFLALISHELRNPLWAIKSGVDLLERAGDGHSQAKLAAMATIRRNVELQTRLVTDLLDLTRLAHKRLEIASKSIRFDQLVAATYDQQHDRFMESGIAFKAFLAPAVWVWGDGDRLTQVLENLLHNALKFTPKGGAVSLTLSVDEDSVRLCVEDSGVGIANEHLAQIFEMFRQAETASVVGGGLGIGLALAKEIVEMHGGRIWAESGGAGAGSRFFVELPTTSAPEAAHEQEPPVSPPFTLTVLLLEDNVDQLEILCEILAMEGWSVETASGAGEALDKLRRGVRPDVILSDISLPDMDGRSFLREARRLPAVADIPAIALSGFGDERDILASHEAGFSHHLVKPPEIDTLICVVRETARSVPSQG